MENNNRSVFSIHGVTGMLIATVLLIAILVGLTIWGIKAQQQVADKPYTLDNLTSVPMKTDVKTANDVMVIKK
ncbi:DUF4006 family protein [Campylobacter geochelonis]|uniref:Periplasmic protein n=1 Tax=Campylobacter geochelonis TaxID=1780362 RepID=A0A128ELT6_9BACT|nr:DUF4006 family protein [Campylobacter geochelonis]QKF71978.1 DUF4006 domain-containing protein [Campylobacter geochelonis]CZE47756.1 periplasmic protein [Campylobacter geochelonis]CZE48979.1 periplasmic protein [Campylobacter geochelonis]CZE49938.1 periplasmic protein [Campylobacter geochelonis]